MYSKFDGAKYIVYGNVSSLKEDLLLAMSNAHPTFSLRYDNLIVVRQIVNSVRQNGRP